MIDNSVVPRLRTDLAPDGYEIPLTSLGVVCIPSKGCCYLSQTDYPNRKGRLSAKTYPSVEAAVDDLYADTVEWTPWRFLCQRITAITPYSEQDLRTHL